MIEVKIKTSDSKIWESDQVLTDLIKASMKGPVKINLLTEGPCCKTSGIDNLLNLIIDKFGFSPSQYTIETSNQIRSSQFREKRTQFTELQFVQRKAKNIAKLPSTLEKKFGLFIGRSNWIRLSLASYINHHYNNISIITYHYDPQSDYHMANFGLEELLNYSWNESDLVLNFLKKLPLKEKTLEYPICWNTEALELDEYYQKLFCDVVCETYYSGNVFFMTEKTMRAIANRRPFLIQGPKFFLKNLKQLGFKTFDSWWDEGYDEDPWNYKHLSLRQNIDFIAQQSQSTIQQWYDEMTPILDHNYNIFLELTTNKILKTKFYVNE